MYTKRYTIINKIKNTLNSVIDRHKRANNSAIIIHAVLFIYAINE